jgi:flagellar hook-associated protein 1 FlgK
MIRSSFAGFTTARLGLSASQSALNITGQNITNINTIGYTRQRVDLASFNLSSRDKFSSVSDTYIGNGVLVNGTSQIRDPFLDVRYRTEIANVGFHDEKLKVMEDLASVLDEVTKDGIHTQIGNLSTALQKLSTEVGNQEFDNIVRSECQSLANLFNRYAKQLETVREDTVNSIQDIDVPAVNKILESISDLNKTIRSNQLHGNPSLELLDQRNLLIDELATYTKIKVQYTTEKVPNSNIELDKLSISLVGETGNLTLVDHENIAKLSCDANADGTVTLKYTYSNPAKGIDITDQDITKESVSGILKATVEMLNCNGEFDADPTSPKGIGYYQKMLDTLANTFAEIMNTANQYTDTDGNVVVGDLFATNDGSAKITARNICIHNDWASNLRGMIPTQNGDQKPVGASDNILHMITLLNTKHTYETDYVDAGGATQTRTLFKGTFEECFVSIGSALALDQISSTSSFENYSSVVNDISNARDSISGVSLDEEGINLLQYQKSYTAAARLMTTLDEAMDVLLNMGVVGR